MANLVESEQLTQNKLTLKPFEIAVKKKDYSSSYPLLKENIIYNNFHTKLYNLAPEIEIENDEIC